VNGLVEAVAARGIVELNHCCPRQDGPIARASENRQFAAVKLTVSGGGLGYKMQQPVPITPAPM
jgi:hypothetical protein